MSSAATTMQAYSAEVREIRVSFRPSLVSVVIVNWNGFPFVHECIQSVRDQDYPATEIVVVDNSSTDGSRDWLRSQTGLSLVELDRNTGFAGGTNAGIRASRGELIALLNNDAVAEPGWLSALVRALADQTIGMVASKVLFYERRDTIDKVGHLMYPDGLNRGRGAGEVDCGQYDDDPEVLFPDGCASLYRRSTLDDTGLFDEQYFAYGDDADLGLRARWRGWSCAYAPDARVYHHHSRTLGKYSPAKAYLVERNRLWVLVKLLPWRLVLASPVLSAWRFFWHAVSVFRGRGLAGGVTREYSPAALLWAAVRAYASGTAGLLPILRKRREVFRRRRVGTREFLALLRRHRISARELAMRD
jgi:GT2 family glycosyltransferase